jgi:alkylation response protein AidB-like acyl-CoA dehydrogenase
VLLARTGPPESAHRGITAMFIDMASRGITVRPLGTMHGGAEFCEVFFDDVAVPFERTLGDEGQGWSVAMDLLPFERSTSLWHRGALLNRRLAQFLDVAEPDTVSAAEVGDVFLQLYALRSRSRATQHRMAAGERLGPETSVDKILLATAEQSLFDLVAAGLADSVVLGDDVASERWRADYLYSRAATIYGGSAEIQRNIVARRLLDLGAEA